MNDMAADDLVKRIRQDLYQAMKTKDTIAVNTLKSLLASITNAEAVTPGEHADKGVFHDAQTGVGSTEVPRKQLAYADILHIIQAEAQELRTTLDVLTEDSSYKAELTQKLDILRQYL